MKYFYSSFLITFLALVISFFIGGFSAVYIAFLLCVLEISLSFDNAVVNAKVLAQMSEVWQKRFITWGIAIAVFGMRFVFPILIVAIAAKIGILETFLLALNEPEKYHEILSMHKNEIYIFGGAFLFMVFCEWFFDKDREIFWFKILENSKFTQNLTKIPQISLILAVILGVFIYFQTQNFTYLIAFFSAILLYEIISLNDKIFSTNGVKSGLGGFLYLECLDASFSFDGVIGAFALSENIFIIMLGLGSGAMFVRSLTIYLVRKKSLQNFAFLEHGAHYAIFALAVIMLLKTHFEISEIITGTIGFGFILVSFFCSIVYNKRG